jgi:hypothetical protein
VPGRWRFFAALPAVVTVTSPIVAHASSSSVPLSEALRARSATSSPARPGLVASSLRSLPSSSSRPRGTCSRQGESGTQSAGRPQSVGRPVPGSGREQSRAPGSWYWDGRLRCPRVGPTEFVRPDHPTQVVWTALTANDGQVAWSPDGQRLALANTGGLAILAADGTAVAALTGCPGTLPPSPGRARPLALPRTRAAFACGQRLEEGPHADISPGLTCSATMGARERGASTRGPNSGRPTRAQLMASPTRSKVEGPCHGQVRLAHLVDRARGP